ncbi:MAG: protein AroM [Thermomicrobiales bacterium]|jgi:protein AroM|nr:protein AroM [Thermomicrobiales bacterium]MEA2529309.1 protein AroM [Thermomicrobiales bacterium]MEA2586219.1 protein AroM [Thermomicrobiales bacterium]
MQTIGFATIAESPRDDVVPAMRAYLPADIRVAERGCLDGLSRAEIEALGPETGEVGIVARLQAGGSTLLSHAKILPRMQRCIDELIRDQGSDLVVILCGADWSEIRAERLVVNPGRLFPGVIGGLAHGRRLGIIKPSSGQVEAERARYRGQGIDAVVTSANPYAGEERLALAHLAGEELRDAGCDLIWMTCIGMDAEMRDVVAAVSGKPVVLAQAILARVVSELLPSRQPALVG